MKKGFFLSFEGIDGCGKSTQVRLLQKALERKGFCVHTIREPGGSRIGKQLRKLLLDPQNGSITSKTEAALYIACMGQNVTEKVIPALKKGCVVIADRFFDSTRAFQGGARGIPLSFLNRLKHLLVSPIEPQITFLIDIPAKIGVPRSRKRDKGGDRIEKESIHHHEKARKSFLKLARQFPRRIHVLDGRLSIDKIHKEVMKVMNRRL